MAVQPQFPLRLAFGPFELDSAGGELRRNGIRVRLAGQPFRILLVLLAHPGELVSREQLREEVWGKETFVDFEHGLNAAVNKLRRALGDTAENPRYIETQPGRGYRFIGMIEHQRCAPNPFVVKSPMHENSPAKRHVRLGWWPAAGAGFAFLILGGVIWWLAGRSPSPTKPAEKSTVVLADFSNATSDRVLDGTFRQVVATELGNSPHLSVLSDARVSQTLRLMTRPADTKLTADVAAEICERTGSAAVVEGSVTSLGGEYVLGLRARNCRTGDVLAQEQAPPVKKDEVFRALRQMVKRFTTGPGRSLPKVEKEPGIAEEATTPSLEAWRSYSAATKAEGLRAPNAEAVSLLQRAVETDPNFALAYAYLGSNQASMGETQLAAQSIAEAYALRNRVSDREYYFITFFYHRLVTRNLELCRQTLESWTRKYPMDLNAHGLLSAFTAVGTAHYDRSVEEGQKAIELDADFAIGYENLALAYVYLNRLPEAEGVLRKAAGRKIEALQFSLLRYFIAFLKGDKVAMESEATHRRAKLEAQGWFSHQEALTLAYQGRLQEADRLSERAESLARQGGFPERAALFAGTRAVWNALYGARGRAQTDAGSALSLCRGRDADYGPAFALALLNEPAPVHKIEADLEKRYPEDTSVQFSYLPALRALEALNQGEAAKALEMTLAATPYDLAIPGTAHITGSFFGALYPVYARGLAYSRLGRHREAAAEFQKILDHPGIMLNDPMGPVARLQLARALFACGDRGKSAAVYRDLLALWNDADPGVPIVQQARAESVRASSG